LARVQRVIADVLTRELELVEPLRADQVTRSLRTLILRQSNVQSLGDWSLINQALAQGLADEFGIPEEFRGQVERKLDLSNPQIDTTAEQVIDYLLEWVPHDRSGGAPVAAPRIGYVGTEDTAQEMAGSGLTAAVVQLPPAPAGRPVYYSGAVALSAAIERTAGPRSGQGVVVAGDDWLPPILAYRVKRNGEGRIEPKPMSLDEEVSAFLLAASKATRSK
jgi:hypothetical protein